MFLPIGTIIDTLALITGGLIGFLFNKKISKEIKTFVFQGIGLCILIIGTQMALKMENLLILIFSILIGGIIGETINCDLQLEKLSDSLKRKIKSKNKKFTKGLIATFLICCVGSLTIVGALNEGLKNDHTLLFTKSILDGFTAIIFSSIYGTGVIFASIPLFLFQGSLSLIATQIKPLLSDLVINQITAAGGILILAVSLDMLNIKKIKVANLLPSLLIVTLLTIFFG